METVGTVGNFVKVPLQPHHLICLDIVSSHTVSVKAMLDLPEIAKTADAARYAPWRANPLWQTSGQETLLAWTMVPLNYAIIQMRSDIIHRDPDGADEKMEQVQRVFGCVV
ncbi:hypothetical protein QQF64_006715 [Cirrhinus molitorella]|uniref:Uncharacterized protein n=1 Tax=Cirrhinus molitorella TaxID=172907 RepID=A0ABR3M9D7_9TELE